MEGRIEEPGYIKLVFTASDTERVHVRGTGSPSGTELKQAFSHTP
ncbi:MAG TPA: hypothetical protein VN414_09945 [Methanosarcina sp.]|nr:hypothetical protein [Methanosarcina sp.]